mgnify:CR=1 FL=1
MNEFDNNEGKQRLPFYSEAMKRFVHGDGCDSTTEALTPVLEVLKVITVDGINGDSGGFGLTYQDMPYHAELQSYLRCGGCGVEEQYTYPFDRLEKDEITKDPTLHAIVEELAKPNRIAYAERIRGMENIFVISDTDPDLGSTIYHRLYDQTNKTVIPLSGGPLKEGKMARLFLQQDPLARVKEVFRRK